jgi:hypothetical protein
MTLITALAEMAFDNFISVFISVLLVLALAIKEARTDSVPVKIIPMTTQ